MIDGGKEQKIEESYGRWKVNERKHMQNRIIYRKINCSIPMPTRTSSYVA